MCLLYSVSFPTVSPSLQSLLLVALPSIVSVPLLRLFASWCKVAWTFESVVRYGGCLRLEVGDKLLEGVLGGFSGRSSRLCLRCRSLLLLLLCIRHVCLTRSLPRTSWTVRLRVLLSAADARRYVDGECQSREANDIDGWRCIALYPAYLFAHLTGHRETVALD